MTAPPAHQSSRVDGANTPSGFAGRLLHPPIANHLLASEAIKKTCIVSLVVIF